MGYGEDQVRYLQETINAVPCDVVLVGTPFDLARLVDCNKPLVRVRYELDETSSEALAAILDKFLEEV